MGVSWLQLSPRSRSLLLTLLQRLVIGEFLALREGLMLGKRVGVLVSLAEVDANVVSSIQEPSLSLGETGSIIGDIKALLKEVGFCKCQAISRVSYVVAHNLASLALSSREDQFWHNVCLSSIFRACSFVLLFFQK
ncbi:hypothetical protein Dsin_029740 [Dipteronia sinensis]|uniref:RNase H type-1 domain-containing protein n=1 Tax=Dipteronia sinensis TaxID=43782 RepID=A0AAE0DVU5_9ROSI|nr:hypothetical protein Dsin_029740 [Dipteronia sinensis]